MRRGEKAIREIEEIEALLEEAQVCRLGLCEDNRPYIVAMCFAKKDHLLFLHSAKEGKKIDIIKKNSNVCFETDKLEGISPSNSPCRYGMRYKSVVGSGVAHILEDPARKQEALNCIMKKYSGKSCQFPPVEMEKTAVIEIRITELSGKKSG
jgi:uncharacterized protein